MYKSTALLLVSLLSLSIAGPVKEECRNFKIKQQFDPIKYFGKPWYVTYALYTNVKYNNGELRCMKYTYNLLDVDVIREILVAYLPKKVTFRMESLINLVDFEDRIAKYDSVARTIDKDERPLMKVFYPLENTVIETDYDNFAVGYSCIKVPDGQIISVYNVLSRVPGVKHLDDKVTAILEENFIGLKLNNFTQIAHDNCKKVEA